MRIALMCVSAEPGHDGVGDYVRQLARAVGARGHVCQIVALADRFVDQATAMLDPQYGFEVVRIPAADWQRAEVDLAVNRMAQFQPDWVSLQMVCYGFEKRGLLWHSSGRFARLRAAPKRHMMFHELWIGAALDSSAKDRAVGWLQRKLLQRTTRIWSPRVVHTSNSVYRGLLRDRGIDAEELPLPGNIPVRDIHPAVARDMILRQLNTSRLAGQPLLAGVFGNIHPKWDGATWMDRVSALCGRLGRRLVIVQFGRPGAGGGKVLAKLRKHAAERVEFLELGERPPEEISALLHGVDFGVATTPRPIIGKSGTAAAMLEHGLPVLVSQESEALWCGTVPVSTPNPQLFRLGDFCDALQRGTLARGKSQPRSDIYETFIDALEHSS